MFDPDEYLMMYRHQHVVDLLEEYSRHASLAIHWRVFGTNDWEVYSPQPVTKRFKMRSVDVHEYVKSIVLLSDVNVDRVSHSHFAYLKSGKKTFDTAGNDLTHQWKDQKYKTVDVVALYHYKYKSWKEYIGKRLDGDVAIGGVVNQDFLKEAKARKIPFHTTVFDDTMWMKMKEYVPKYALYDIIYQ
jgi:hypothetical protein